MAQRDLAKNMRPFERLLHRFGLGLLYRHPLIVLALLLCVSVAAIIWNTYRQEAHLVEIQALFHAERQAGLIAEMRALYTSEVVNRLDGSGVTVSHDYEDRQHAIPLPATLNMALNERLDESGDITSRLYSPHPFPWRAEAGGLRDEFGHSAWRNLSAAPDRPFFRFEEIDGRSVLRYAIADEMQTECVACHNSHPESPKTDWAEGDLRGVIEIVSPIDLPARALRTGMMQTAGLMVAITAAGLMLLWLVVRHLQRMTMHAQGLAEAATETGQQLEELAHYDPLSGLPNRALFQDRLDSALARARRAKEQVGLLLLDLDHFKHVNDTLGHAAGDMLLTEVAKRLTNVVRDEDTVARLGGDEFVIIQSGFKSSESPITLGNRIFEALSTPAVIEGHEIPLGASIGMTIYPDDARETTQLLKNADLALYRAKDDGRGTMAYYSKILGESARRRMDLAAGLRAALKDDEFALLYQPKFNTRSGDLVGAEALIRWTKPGEGPVSPGEFIPIAESTGLIAEIGDWILATACGDMQFWAQTGAPPTALSINLSAVQFREPTLLDRIRQTIEESGVDPKMLEFELTETALMRDPDFTAETLSRLVEIGCCASIDDFGTGYSSLAYLKRFPVSKLKIDQSFTREMVNNVEDEAIVRGIVSLAHTLQIQTIAEGVETDDQMSRLRDIGCDEVQGYLLSRPISPSDFLELIRRHTNISAT